jgi:co-chaperonin GroES (HSP10)
MAARLKYRPLGARLLVEPIITTLSLEERAAQAGLEIVVEHENRPRPTQGRVVALGSDPLLREEVKEGNIVFFHPYSGSEVTLVGKTYRQLEHTEVTGVMEEDVPTLSSPRRGVSSSEDQPSLEQTQCKPE